MQNAKNRQTKSETAEPFLARFHAISLYKINDSDFYNVIVLVVGIIVSSVLDFNVGGSVKHQSHPQGLKQHLETLATSRVVLLCPIRPIPNRARIDCECRKAW